MTDPRKSLDRINELLAAVEHTQEASNLKFTHLHIIKLDILLELGMWEILMETCTSILSISHNSSIESFTMLSLHSLCVCTDTHDVLEYLDSIQVIVNGFYRNSPRFVLEMIKPIVRLSRGSRAILDKCLKIIEALQTTPETTAESAYIYLQGKATLTNIRRPK